MMFLVKNYTDFMTEFSLTNTELTTDTGTTGYRLNTDTNISAYRWTLNSLQTLFPVATDD